MISFAASVRVSRFQVRDSSGEVVPPPLDRAVRNKHIGARSWQTIPAVSEKTQQSEAKQSKAKQRPRAHPSKATRSKAKQSKAKQRNAKQCSGHEHCKAGAKQSEAKLGSRRSTHSGVPKYYMHGRTARVASFLFVVTYKRIEYATNPETQMFRLYCRQAFAELSQTRPPRPLRRARVLIFNARLLACPYMRCLCSVAPSYHHVHS